MGSVRKEDSKRVKKTYKPKEANVKKLEMYLKKLNILEDGK